MDMNVVPSRRNFIASSALAGTALMLSSAGVHAAGKEGVLKIGLIGCGGRGTGAAENALKADKNVKLVAMADAFEDQAKNSLNYLNGRGILKDKVDVKPDAIFIGFDGYKKVIEMCDVVLLTTPPGFRPLHFKAAVEAGKHVFMEKPVAVDAPGVRSVIASAREAAKKNLSVLTGYCFRYDAAKRAGIQRIHEGAIGKVLAIHCTYLTGDPWAGRLRGKSTKIDSMEYQMRNWYYFNWLSGDHNVEQHCHNHDKAMWVLKDETPISATGIGGRQQRTDPKFGNIFDHHAVVYEFKGGVKVFSFCRQQGGLSSDINDHIFGTNGEAHLMPDPRIISGGKTWSYEGPNDNMYDVEHVEFFAGIRSGKLINDGERAAHATLMSIMGRMATYTGRKITWDQAMNSKEDLTPPKYDWIDLPVAPVPVPGVTKFV